MKYEYLKQSYVKAQKTRLNIHNQIQNSHTYNASLHQKYISSIVAELQAKQDLNNVVH
jgi:hypothetical protein